MNQFRFTENGSSAPIKTVNDGYVSIYVEGNFDGAIVNFEVQPVLGASFYPVISVSQQSALNCNYRGHRYRFSVSGATANTDIQTYIVD